MQYDKSTIKDENVGFEKKIFLSSSSFKYPTVKLKQLKELDVNSIAADDCILFMWTTGPQMANSIELGEAWGFEYKTVAFVWIVIKWFRISRHMEFRHVCYLPVI